MPNNDNSIKICNIDEAIQMLTKAKNKIGGDKPLFFWFDAQQLEQRRDSDVYGYYFNLVFEDTVIAHDAFFTYDTFCPEIIQEKE